MDKVEQLINQRLERLNKKKEAVKVKKEEANKVAKKKGGARENSGRLRRMDEIEIQAQLYPHRNKAIGALVDLVEAKDINAVKLFLQYFWGMPTQRIEGKIEGNLSQINIQVVRPEIIQSTTEDTECQDVTT